MNDAQLEKLITALKPEKEEKNRRGLLNAEFAIVDVLQKVAVSLTAFGVVWLVGGVNEMQKDISVIKVTQTQNKEQINEFKDFTKKPRFSFDDFISQIQPLKQRLEQNEMKLIQRSEWMNSTAERVSKLEGKYEIILEKLNTINKDISTISDSLKQGD